MTPLAIVAFIAMVIVNVYLSFRFSAAYWETDYQRIAARSNARALIIGAVLQLSGLWLGWLLVKLFGEILIPAQYLPITLSVVGASGFIAGAVAGYRATYRWE
jgi:hypothetical protein